MGVVLNQHKSCILLNGFHAGVTGEAAIYKRRGTLPPIPGLTGALALMHQIQDYLPLANRLSCVFSNWPLLSQEPSPNGFDLSWICRAACTASTALTDASRASAKLRPWYAVLSGATVSPHCLSSRFKKGVGGKFLVHALRHLLHMHPCICCASPVPIFNSCTRTPCCIWTSIFVWLLFPCPFQHLLAHILQACGFNSAVRSCIMSRKCFGRR